ncbi:hypothetical protein Scep_029938 [Stephania cephalantha]|uniref:Uncharacterized protein n=1 Tax=Stephania cephalantha TaxID=152367 RepID=A0AAP0E288_9MAGN
MCFFFFFCSNSFISRMHLEQDCQCQMAYNQSTTLIVGNSGPSWPLQEQQN